MALWLEKYLTITTHSSSNFSCRSLDDYLCTMDYKLNLHPPHLRDHPTYSVLNNI